MSGTLVICDSREATALARRLWPEAVVTSDNPLLAHAESEAGHAVLNTDALISQAEAAALGLVALEITRDIDEAIANSGVPARFGLLPEYLYLTAAVSRLLCSLAHRGAGLARALERGTYSRIEIATADLGRWTERNPFVQPWFGHPARAMAEQGFLGSLPWSYTEAATDIPASINDAAADSLLRRVAVMPLPVIFNEMRARFARGAAASDRVRVGELNETLRETLPYLLDAGVTCAPAGRMRGIGGVVPNSFASPAPKDAEIARLVGGAAIARLMGTGHFREQQAQAISDLVGVHLTVGLPHLARQIDAMDATIAKDFPNGGVLLSNGFFGPAGSQAYGLYARRGVKVVEFEHGVTAGISALTNTKLDHRSPPKPALHIVCSPRAAAAFSGGRPDPSVEPVGLADAVRTLQHPRLQRRLARRTLGLSAREPVVMHVSTLPYYGNQRPGLGTPTETRTFDIDRTLLTVVYPNVRQRVVFKQYPTQRFPFEPLYDALFELPPHVSITKDEDFRYIRAAADVIVTMTPTSTLGWCAGAGVPIVWLASKLINPLADEKARTDFAAAFPCVDLDSDDWSDKLTATLNDLAALRRDWRSRESARRSLYREAITGPEGITGKRAAERILALLDESEPFAAAPAAKRPAA